MFPGIHGLRETERQWNRTSLGVMWTWKCATVLPHRSLNSCSLEQEENDSCVHHNTEEPKQGLCTLLHDLAHWEFLFISPARDWGHKLNMPYWYEGFQLVTGKMTFWIPGFVMKDCSLVQHYWCFQCCRMQDAVNIILHWKEIRKKEKHNSEPSSKKQLSVLTIECVCTLYYFLELSEV